jgi:PKD domain
MRRTAAFAALIIGAVGAAPAVALAATTATNVIYVDGSTGLCTDSGTGTSAAPFCTLQAGVDAAAAGDTVQVSGSVLYAPVTISVSGTAAAPITIEGSATSTTNIGVAKGSTNTAPAFTFDDAHYVTVSGFLATGVTTAAASVTGGSSDVTLDRLRARVSPAQTASPLPLIEVAGSASAVTISRSELIVDQLPIAPAIQIDAGSSDDVVTTNVIESLSNSIATSYPPVISVLGAADTAVTSNTVDTGWDCGTALAVAGGSGGSSIENNIFQTGQAYCLTGTAPTGIVNVTDSAADPVTADYNVLSPLANVPSVLDYYDWNGTVYGSPSTFTTATGEGAHDLDATPTYSTFPSPDGNSPAIDAANSAAPGMLATDYFGNPCTYDPFVAITGAGSPAYCTRGAVQYQPTQTDDSGFSTQAANALSVTATLTQPPVNPQGYTYQWGDGQTTQTTNAAETHRYAEPGTYTIIVTTTDAVGGTSSTTSAFTTAGSDFTPYGPIRLLDTRHGTGAPQAPVASGATIRLRISGTGSIPAGVTAVALNLTAVDGTGTGYVTAYADGVTRPSVSNLNYGGGQTVANEAIVPVVDGYIDLTNSGVNPKVTVDLLADITGYFTQSAASGFEAVTPARILDTRKGLGAPKAQVGPGGSVKLAIEGADGGVLPASGITAVSLHVTAVDTKAGGYVTGYPDGQPKPIVSNLNYTTNSTVSNTVIVPVGMDGEVDLYNGSPSGATDLIADVTGYYTKNQDSTIASYVPLTPARALDTRKNPTPVYSNTSVSLLSNDNGASAYVMNLTAVEGTGNGYLTAAPTGGTVPGVSTLNYLSGQTVANLAQVAAGPANPKGAITIANSEISTSIETSVEFIVDLFGYYSHS